MKNTIKKLGVALFAMALLWSCGKDDGTTPSGNAAPVIAAQEFNAFEAITDTEVIGTVLATDADQDALTFSIKTNDDALFEITASGDLSLAAGKALNFATKAQHSITVEVSDGEDTASAAITIKVVKEGTDPTNTAPVIAPQEFTAAEDIKENENIGVVVATDVDNDALTFSMVTNDNDLFKIGTTGVLTLDTGKTLDFETATQHSITVRVSDGDKTATAQITIKVTNVVEDGEMGLADDPASFITTWKTTMANEEIIIGKNSDYTYDYMIDWGDGTVEQINSGDNDSHVYASAGTYTVAIKGQFPRFDATSFAADNALKIMSIEQWGAIEWEIMRNTFNACENMVYNAVDVPDLSKVTDMTNMFIGATSFNGDISGWDTSSVIVMSGMFRGAASFNADISGWNTSSVTTMASMFHEASAFDQNLGNWDIGSVTNMQNMFDNSGMSVGNILTTTGGWRNFVVQNNGPEGIIIGVDGITFCPEAAENGIFLENNYNWNFTGQTLFQQNCN